MALVSAQAPLLRGSAFAFGLGGGGRTAQRFLYGGSRCGLTQCLLGSVEQVVIDLDGWCA